jgi:hypothetical protein
LLRRLQVADSSRSRRNNDSPCYYFADATTHADDGTQLSHTFLFLTGRENKAGFLVRWAVRLTRAGRAGLRGEGGHHHMLRAVDICGRAVTFCTACEQPRRLRS